MKPRAHSQDHGDPGHKSNAEMEAELIKEDLANGRLDSGTSWAIP